MSKLLEEKGAGLSVKPRRKAPVCRAAAGRGARVTAGFPSTSPPAWAQGPASARARPRQSRDSRAALPALRWELPSRPTRLSPWGRGGLGCRGRWGRRPEALRGERAAGRVSGRCGTEPGRHRGEPWSPGQPADAAVSAGTGLWWGLLPCPRPCRGAVLGTAVGSCPPPRWHQAGAAAGGRCHSAREAAAAPALCWRCPPSCKRGHFHGPSWGLRGSDTDHL